MLAFERRILLKHLFAAVVLIAVGWTTPAALAAEVLKTYWQHLDLVQCEKEIDRIVVNFAGAKPVLKGAKEMPPAIGIDPTYKAKKAGATAEITWPAQAPFKARETCTIAVTFAGTDTPKFKSADLYRNGAKVATLGDQWLIHDLNSKPIGRMIEALVPEPTQTEKDLLDAIRQWGVVLGASKPNDNDAKAMAALYAADGTLLPTIGGNHLYRNRPLVADWEECPRIANYFRYKFLPKLPELQPLVHARVHATAADANFGSVQGLYTFKVLPKGKKPVEGQAVVKEEIPARFTFVFRKECGKWRIVQHHSSAVPPADPKPEPNPAPKPKPTPEPGPPSDDICRGDLDLDGWVDGVDLGLLLAEFGDGSETADLDGDGWVDEQDVELLLAAWGPCPE